MKCPFCNVWSDVVESRTTLTGTRRRRRCANGHRFTTHERVTSHTARKVEDRNRQAAQRVLAGQTQTEVARQFRMPRSELSRYMAAHHPQHNGRSAGQLARWANTPRRT